MRVVFSRRSVVRLREIQSWIAYDNVTAAAQGDQPHPAVRRASRRHPRLGTVWRDGPTRALVVSGLPYRIHYRLDEEAGLVQIITVAHTSRRPPGFRLIPLERPTAAPLRMPQRQRDRGSRTTPNK